MHERPESSTTEPEVAPGGRRKRTKKKPLWYRIIYDEPMVALVRLLGHDGIPLQDVQQKCEPLIEKFGRERLQEVAIEITEVVGDGDDAVAQLTAEAQKLAVQLLGRPKTKRPTVVGDTIDAGAASSTRQQSKNEQAAAAVVDGVTDEFVPPSVSATRPPNDWANYETQCVASLLHRDPQFVEECLHLTKQCSRTPRYETTEAGISMNSPASTEQLADRLQQLVRGFNPLATDSTLFADLLDSAINSVDWYDLANSFLKRLDDSETTK